MLELRNLSVTLGRGTLLERHVLKDLSLRVLPGEFVMIIGSNGAGKSTLFHAISGDVNLDAGQILLDNVDMTHLPSYKRAPFIAKVLQDPRAATVDDMTIEENLSFASLRGHRAGLSPHRTRARLALFGKRLSLLNMGLENRMDELAGHLSGGQRQALSLIMATMADSKVLLLDEITSALDPKIANLVMDITEKVVTQYHKTTLMITHNMAHALLYGHRTVLLHEGRIIKEYSQQERSRLKPMDLASVFNNF